MKRAKLNFLRAITENDSNEERERNICLVTKVFRLLEISAYVGGMREVWHIIRGTNRNAPKGGVA